MQKCDRMLNTAGWSHWIWYLITSLSRLCHGKGFLTKGHLLVLSGTVGFWHFTHHLCVSTHDPLMKLKNFYRIKFSAPSLLTLEHNPRQFDVSCSRGWWEGCHQGSFQGLLDVNIWWRTVAQLRGIASVGCVAFLLIPFSLCVCVCMCVGK